MADYDSKTQLALPSDNLVTLTHVVYALHAFSAITGLTTAALDRKSTRLNSSHIPLSRMPSSA